MRREERCWKEQTTEARFFVEIIPFFHLGTEYLNRKAMTRFLHVATQCLQKETTWRKFKALTGLLSPPPSLFRYFSNQHFAARDPHLLHTQRHNPLQIIRSFPNPQAPSPLYLLHPFLSGVIFASLSLSACKLSFWKAAQASPPV